MRRDALLWNLAVLGEERFAQVPWRQPARLRHRIVHGYWSIDLGVVHTTADQQLPGFAAQLRTVLQTLQQDLDGRDDPAPGDEGPLPPS